VNRPTGRRTTIPNWGARDLRQGTISQILRDLAIDGRAFDQA
jgi:predicted RNA binding protein YcfA (HicA-like mRNA interferase family)